MVRANIARHHGDNFQARLFWLYTARLLDPGSSIVRVAYEVGPKGFDDIVIDYDPARPYIDHKGVPFTRRYIQCKWHTTPGIFGYEDLTDPAFINATSYSLLENALKAQLQHAPDGTGCRFQLLTNWRIRADDPLLDIVRKESDALDLEKLFEGKTERSRMGKLRKSWCSHLGIDETGLRLFARTLDIAETPESLAGLRERLDELFALVGLKRVAPTDTAYIYDDLIEKLLAQNRADFDRESFAEFARAEGLLVGQPLRQKVIAIGVRSFMHSIDNLEDRCDHMLNLVAHFDGRYLRDGSDWQAQILPELSDFLRTTARDVDELRLVLDTHVSLAFAAGAVLNVKSGKRIEVEQRTDGRHYWSRNDAPHDVSWPKIVFDNKNLAGDGQELAVAVGLTHDLGLAVRDYVTKNLDGAGLMLTCLPVGGPSQQSVRCGAHGWLLAEAIASHVSSLRAQGHTFSRTHLFAAGPNAVAFFLGQLQKVMGPVTVYEWDFEGLRGGGYIPGIQVD